MPAAAEVEAPVDVRPPSSAAGTSTDAGGVVGSNPASKPTTPAAFVRRDYYRTLGLDRAADAEAVKSSYRKLALKYHPDRNKAAEAPEAFRAVSEAYDVLSNKKWRAIYDQYGHDGLRNGVPARNGEFEGFVGGYAYHESPEETFAKFFGGTNPFADFFAVLTESLPTSFGPKFGGLYGMNTGNPILSPPTKDPPIEMDIMLTLEELWAGAIKKMRVTRKVLTEDGVTTEDQQKIFTIHVKRGWKDGTRVTFPNEWNQGPNKIPSDVVFIIREIPHARFTRSGDDLVMTTKMTLGQALSGTIMSIQTLDGRTIQVPINEVVHPAYVKEVAHEGMPVSQTPSRRGKLLLKFEISFPTYLSEEKKGMLKKIIP
ncbi:hypothetical protein DFJ73DRAFT_512445 [Zopfochytrium polystomum]|nr:hypothetical protein DFJ73DRAFT_512445 [Zopfochytrium polystomum]